MYRDEDQDMPNDSEALVMGPNVIFFHGAQNPWRRPWLRLKVKFTELGSNSLVVFMVAMDVAMIRPATENFDCVVWDFFLSFCK